MSEKNKKTYIATIKNLNLKVDYREVFCMISSDHQQDCCEAHYLDFDNSRQDFKMVEQMLSKIDKIEIYWEEWMGVTFFFYDGEERVWIFIPWRAENNWYYSDDLQLIINTPDNWKYEFDITEYQTRDYYNI